MAALESFATAPSPARCKRRGGTRARHSGREPRPELRRAASRETMSTGSAARDGRGGRAMLSRLSRRGREVSHGNRIADRDTFRLGGRNGRGSRARAGSPERPAAARRRARQRAGRRSRDVEREAVGRASRGSAAGTGGETRTHPARCDAGAAGEGAPAGAAEREAKPERREREAKPERREREPGWSVPPVPRPIGPPRTEARTGPIQRQPAIGWAFGSSLGDHVPAFLMRPTPVKIRD
jgi:hypothetical protein